MKKMSASVKQQVIKTDQITCVKEFGLDGLITCNYRGYASEIHMNPVDIRLSNVDCKQYPDHDAQCKLRSPSPFTPGHRYTKDFDYCGMLRAGVEASIHDAQKVLYLLSDSFEAVNYHKEAGMLRDAIDLISKGKVVSGEKKLKEFNKICKKAVEAVC